MELLTDELRAQLPPLYAQEHESDAMVCAKFFTPWTNWMWYATEGSQQEDDYIFFGFVFGNVGEWGYFSLNELQSVRGPAGLTIERDVHFSPARWSEVEKRHKAQFVGINPAPFLGDGGTHPPPIPLRNRKEVDQDKKQVRGE
jgi:Protein of unknown function (DUF2958)